MHMADKLQVCMFLCLLAWPCNVSKQHFGRVAALSCSCHRQQPRLAQLQPQAASITAAVFCTFARLAATSSLMAATWAWAWAVLMPSLLKGAVLMNSSCRAALSCRGRRNKQQVVTGMPSV
jgi:hypothetical protein